ncbi:MAG: DUF4198 domain-containing protein [Hyphomonas sp.]
MKLISKFGIAAAVIAFATAGTASAHRMWLLPSTFQLSGEEQWITVDGAISNDLYFPNHVALPLQDVSITAPDGTVRAPVNGWTGKFRSSFDVKLDQQGTWKISETGRMYFAMFIENSEMQRQRGSWKELEDKGVLDKPDVKLMQSARKVETFVTLGAPSRDVLEPSGIGIELVPTTHPNDAYAGEAVTLGYLVNGKPAAGLEVDIVRGNDRYRDDPEILSLTTDEDGNISFTPTAPGRYWAATQTESPGTVNGRAVENLTSHVLTFEVLIP